VPLGRSARLNHTVGVTSRPVPAISTVAEIMTSAPTALALDATVLEARSTMLNHGVSALPIIDSKVRPVGIVTKTDLMSALADDVPVAVLMANDVLTCSRDSPYGEAARTMRANRVHHLVVVDGEKLIGMLSVFDLLQVIESIGSAESPPA
jgi:CBS domain-containing protein